MSVNLHCFRCGASLEKLSLPLSRRDECPQCTIHVHVCRMCRHFDPDVPKQCREDDAEEVYEKEKVNFCEWFVPSPEAFDPARAEASSRAKNELASLFGEDSGDTPARDALLDKAEDLFK
jgi:hypothetical protein